MIRFRFVLYCHLMDGRTAGVLRRLSLVAATVGVAIALLYAYPRFLGSLVFIGIAAVSYWLLYRLLAGRVGRAKPQESPVPPTVPGGEVKVNQSNAEPPQTQQLAAAEAKEPAEPKGKPARQRQKHTADPTGATQSDSTATQKDPAKRRTARRNSGRRSPSRSSRKRSGTSEGPS